MAMSTKKYPIAERFTSLQGEGLYTGTLMYFIRFAGCSVGKRMSATITQNLSVSAQDPLNIYRERCTTYDGRSFLCDTDFRTKEVMSVDEILQSIPAGVRHICLTGGEPLDQPLTPLFDAMLEMPQEFYIHIETSGTKDIEKAYPAFNEEDTGPQEAGGWMWLTVSPKKGCLPGMVAMANEVKLLVDDGFDENVLPDGILDHDLVWIQPINEEFQVHDPNVQRCIDLIKKHPNWRMSTQMHKVWKVR